jgi:hypothetical protein
VTDVEEEHHKGMYDEPVSGKKGGTGLWTPPQKTPGDSGPTKIPGLDKKGLLHNKEGNLNQAYTESGVTNETFGRGLGAGGFGLHMYSTSDLFRERKEAEAQESHEPRHEGPTHDTYGKKQEQEN